MSVGHMKLTAILSIAISYTPFYDHLESLRLVNGLKQFNSSHLYRGKVHRPNGHIHTAKQLEEKNVVAVGRTTKLRR
ncbi:hypothetical protein BLOT_002994 [Blomia tropicalis]|nr:hypothetical protein BLOT_002994 [Blomia tropicalis]